MAKALLEIQRVQNSADIVEIWLDQIEDLNIERLFTVKKKPYLCVYKSKREKGKFTGLTENRIKVLQTCIDLKSECIEINIEAPMKWIKFLASQKKRSKLFISYQNYLKTPSFRVLSRLTSRMVRLGGDVCKVATTIKHSGDIATLFQLAHYLDGKKIKHVIIGLGDNGQMTHYYSPLLNNQITYAPVDIKKASEPGQISLNQLETTWKLLHNS